MLATQRRRSRGSCMTRFGPEMRGGGAVRSRSAESIADANDLASGKRASGETDSAFANSASTKGLTSGLCRRMLSAGRRSRSRIVACGVAPGNGGLPANISYSTQASE